MDEKKIRGICETLWNQGCEASDHPRDRGHDIDCAIAALTELEHGAEEREPYVPYCRNDCGPCRDEPGPWHQRGCTQWSSTAPAIAAPEEKPGDGIPRSSFPALADAVLEPAPVQSAPSEEDDGGLLRDAIATIDKQRAEITALRAQLERKAERYREALEKIRLNSLQAYCSAECLCAARDMRNEARAALDGKDS